MSSSAKNQLYESTATPASALASSPSGPGNTIPTLRAEQHANAIYQNRLAPTFPRTSNSYIRLGDGPSSTRHQNNQKDNFDLSPKSTSDPLRRQTTRRRRRFCCCFRTRRGCIITILLITVIFLGGLGAAAFFLWPRAPVIVVSDPYSLSNVEALTQAGDLANASPSAPYSFTLNFGVDMSVYSPNYEDVKVNQLTINVCETSFVLENATLFL
jgi:hypothetical protein